MGENKYWSVVFDSGSITRFKNRRDRTKCSYVYEKVPLSNDRRKRKRRIGDTKDSILGQWILRPEKRKYHTGYWLCKDDSY